MMSCGDAAGGRRVTRTWSPTSAPGVASELISHTVGVGPVLSTVDVTGTRA